MDSGHCHGRVNAGSSVGWQNENGVWRSSGKERQNRADRSQTNNRAHFPACPRGLTSRFRETCRFRPQQDGACWAQTCRRRDVAASPQQRRLTSRTAVALKCASEETLEPSDLNTDVLHDCGWPRKISELIHESLKTQSCGHSDSVAPVSNSS